MAHKGLLWEKVADLDLSEKDLMQSFDSEEDFVKYMDREPKLEWDAVCGSKMDQLKAKAKGEQPEKGKMERLKEVAKNDEVDMD